MNLPKFTNIPKHFHISIKKYMKHTVKYLMQSDYGTVVVESESVKRALSLHYITEVTFTNKFLDLKLV